MPLTIGLDVDDVLLDHIPAWVSLYNVESGDCLTASHVTEWDIRRFVTPAFCDRIYDLRTPALYERVRAVPGSIGGVAALQFAGHRLVAITNEPRGPNIAAKVAALNRYFPTITEIVVAKEKRSAVGVDVLIDDNPRAMPDLLFSRPHNRNVRAYFTKSEWYNLTAYTRRVMVNGITFDQYDRIEGWDALVALLCPVVECG